MVLFYALYTKKGEGASLQAVQYHPSADITM